MKLKKQFDRSNKLYKIRIASGLSRPKAAIAVHRHFAVIYNQERGKCPIDEAVLELLQIKTGQHPHYKPISDAYKFEGWKV